MVVFKRSTTLLLLLIVLFIFKMVNVEGASQASASSSRLVTLQSGKSYEFDNISKGIGTIKAVETENGIFDYVVYDKAGSRIAGEFNANYLDSIQVPAAGKVVVTVQQGSAIMETSEKFTVKASAEPAYTRAVVKAGKSYEFNNTSKANGTIEVVQTESGLFDYIVYDKAGSRIAGEFNTNYLGSISEVPAGGKVVVTVQQGEVVIGGAKKFFTGKASSEPAYARAVVKAGKSYEFNNTSKAKRTIEVVRIEAGIFDYIVYDKAGNITEGELASTTNSIEVPAGGKVVVTVQEEAVAIGGAKKFFTGKVSAEPAYARAVVKLGKSYEFNNTSTGKRTIEVVGAGGIFDFVVYDKAGDMFKGELASTTSSIEVPAGGKVVVTVQEGAVAIGGAKKFFTGKASAEPAYTTAVIEFGKAYELKNTSKKRRTVQIYTGFLGVNSYGYELYDKTGKKIGSNFNTLDLEIQVPAGGRVVIAGNDTIRAGGPKKFFTGKVSKSPYESAVLEPGESYEFTNISKRKEFIKVNPALPNSYDYIVYDKVGNIVKGKVSEVTSADIEVPAGGKLIITAYDLSEIGGLDGGRVLVGGSRGSFTGKASSNPVYERATFMLGESYELKNKSTKEGIVRVYGSSLYEYTVYDKAGKIITKKVVDTGYSDIGVPAGGKVIIKSRDEYVVAGGPKTMFKGTVIY